MSLPENVLLHGTGIIAGHTKDSETLELAIAFILSDIDVANWPALQDKARLKEPLDFYFADGDAFHHDTLAKVRAYFVKRRDQFQTYEEAALAVLG